MPTLTKHRLATLTIDGQPVRVHVQRLQLEQAEAFRAHLRQLLSGADEQTLAGEDAQFVRQAIETYLSVPPGELDVDGESVTTGAQLLAIIGENPTLVLRALLAIGGTTSPTADESLRSASESALVPSSDASPQAPAGPRPGPTAASAAPAGTAAIADATAETARPSSGPTTIVN